MSDSNGTDWTDEAWEELTRQRQDEAHRRADLRWRRVLDRRPVRAENRRIAVDWVDRTISQLPPVAARRGVAVLDVWQRLDHFRSDIEDVMDGSKRFLLIERDDEGERWATTHESPDDAASYHVNQENPEDWPIEALVDLDTGEMFRGEKRACVVWSVFT